MSRKNKKRSLAAWIIPAAVFCVLFAAGWMLNRYAPSALYRMLYPEPTVSLQKAEESFTAELKTGDCVAFGEYMGKPVVWKCIFCDGKPVLQSARILDFLLQ